MRKNCEKYFDTDYLNLHIDDNNDIEKIDEKLSNKHYDIIYINTPTFFIEGPRKIYIGLLC